MGSHAYGHLSPGLKITNQNTCAALNGQHSCSCRSSAPPRLSFFANVDANHFQITLCSLKLLRDLVLDPSANVDTKKPLGFAGQTDAFTLNFIQPYGFSGPTLCIGSDEPFRLSSTSLASGDSPRTEAFLLSSRRDFFSYQPREFENFSMAWEKVRSQRHSSILGSISISCNQRQPRIKLQQKAVVQVV